MHTIRTRIISLTMTAILVSVLVLGLITFLSIHKASEKSSTEMMRLICDERAQMIDDYVGSIELAQNIVSRFAVSELSIAPFSEAGLVGADGWSKGLLCDNPETQRMLDSYLDGYIARVEDVFRSAVNNNSGIISYYFRINPELSEREEGFLYTRISSVSFQGVKLTNLRTYSPDDMEHVGWYYEPLRRGMASWLEPYDNENLNAKMVSYVTPVYKNQTFIGVIGVDVAYSTLADIIRNIHIYETDYAFLMSADGTLIYHPTIESGYNLAREVPELAAMVERMETESANEEPVRYKMDRQARRLFYTTISTGQVLALTAPEREIAANWTKMRTRLVVVAAALLLVFVEISVVTVRRITQPLQRLTEASRAIAEGNYNVQLDAAGDDEVGTLTRAFQQLVERMKVYINDLNSMAYRDALTGVKNKAAYEISARKLNDMIRMGGADNAPEFALIMLDCNDLKKINDTYGHEKGDVYLRAACTLVCNAFPHSPVFRVGGDEFAVILHKEPYNDRETLLQDFEHQVEKVNAQAENPWERVSIAKGVACYDPAVDPNVEAVLKRADTLMYEEKRHIKQSAAGQSSAGAEDDTRDILYE